MKRTMLVMITLIMSIMLIGCDDNVNKVKNGYFKLDESLTIGTAIDTYKYVKSYEWTSFESTRERTIVELKINLVDYEVEQNFNINDGKVNIQFRIKKTSSEDELPFEMCYTEFGGVAVNTNTNQTKEFNIEGLSNSQKLSLLRAIYSNDPIYF